MDGHTAARASPPSVLGRGEAPGGGVGGGGEAALAVKQTAWTMETHINKEFSTGK